MIANFLMQYKPSFMTKENLNKVTPFQHQKPTLFVHYAPGCPFLCALVSVFMPGVFCCFPQFT